MGFQVLTKVSGSKHNNGLLVLGASASIGAQGKTLQAVKVVLTVVPGSLVTEFISQAAKTIDEW